MTIKEYDGAEDQLLNMGSYLVDHDVLRSYLRQYVTEGYEVLFSSFFSLNVIFMPPKITVLMKFVQISKHNRYYFHIYSMVQSDNIVLSKI